MHVGVEEGWKLLLRKGGDTRRYRDALLKDKCAFFVKVAIAEFGMQHGVCRNALLSHVQVFLSRRLYEGDGQDPYYSLEDVELEDGEDGKDENDDKGSECKEESDNDKDGDDDSSDEDGEGKGSDEEGVTVNKGGRGVPLYSRKPRILLGNKKGSGGMIGIE
jgi:hypothetical protein